MNMEQQYRPNTVSPATRERIILSRRYFRLIIGWKYFYLSPWAAGNVALVCWVQHSDSVLSGFCRVLTPRYQCTPK